MKLNLVKNSFISSALWFGVSAAVQVFFVIGFWSGVFSSISYFPALLWGFISGAIVGLIIWHIPAAHAPSRPSFDVSMAALCGGIIGPASLLAALLADSAFDYLAGNLANMKDVSETIGMVAFGVAYSSGVSIFLFSIVSGVFYSYVRWKVYLLYKC